jgi:FkbM family methyltransferase
MRASIDAAGDGENLPTVEPLYRLVRAIRNYRNPLSIIYRRKVGAPIVKIHDRKTGLKFLCRRGGDHMMSESFYARIYDIPFVPIRQGDVVMDIGANHGFYSCWAAHQRAIVHAFEPDPDTYKLLLQNIAMNGLENRVFPHPVAVAAQTGDMKMFCTADMGGGLSTIIPAFAANTGIDVVSQISVQTLSLADALQLCGGSRVRICKMDCEGAEKSILAHLDSATLEQFDGIVMEYHPQAYELDEFMKMLLGWKGFHLSKVVGHDRDLGNANLSIVRTESILEWCNVPPTEPVPERSPFRTTPPETTPPTQIAKQAIA